MPFDYPDDEKTRWFTHDKAKQFAIRLELHRYRTRRYEKLRYKNLRQDFHELGIVPMSYLSYCCSQKAPFRERGSLARAVDDLCSLGDLRMLDNEVAAEHFDLKIDPKSTLFMQDQFARRNFLRDLETVTFWNTEFEVPVGYPVHRLAYEAEEEARAEHQVTGRSFNFGGRWVPRTPID